ncbi:MAG: hypothetical protein RR685_03380, partial [Hungatella sp.]
MQFSEEPMLYAEYQNPSLQIYRKLYRRTTDIQNGLSVFSFSADRLKSKMQSLLEYQNQQIFLIDSEAKLVWPASENFSNETLLSLTEQMASTSEKNNSVVVNQDYTSYTATYLQAPRSYGFSYLLLTP